LILKTYNSPLTPSLIKQGKKAFNYDFINSTVLDAHFFSQK